MIPETRVDWLRIYWLRAGEWAWVALLLGITFGLWLALEVTHYLGWF